MGQDEASSGAAGHRFYVAPDAAQAGRVRIEGPQAHQICRVRLRAEGIAPTAAAAGDDHRRQHRDTEHQAGDRRQHRRRLLTVGSAGLFGAIFLIPAAAFLINYLQNERSFAAGQIALFQVLTTFPAEDKLITVK